MDNNELFNSHLELMSVGRKQYNAPKGQIDYNDFFDNSTTGFIVDDTKVRYTPSKTIQASYKRLTANDLYDAITSSIVKYPHILKAFRTGKIDIASRFLRDHYNKNIDLIKAMRTNEDLALLISWVRNGLISPKNTPKTLRASKTNKIIVVDKKLVRGNFKPITQHSGFLEGNFVILAFRPQELNTIPTKSVLAKRGKTNKLYDDLKSFYSPYYSFNTFGENATNTNKVADDETNDLDDNDNPPEYETLKFETPRGY